MELVVGVAGFSPRCVLYTDCNEMPRHNFLCLIQLFTYIFGRSITECISTVLIIQVTS